MGLFSRNAVDYAQEEVKRCHGTRCECMGCRRKFKESTRKISRGKKEKVMF